MPSMTKPSEKFSVWPVESSPLCWLLLLMRCAGPLLLLEERWGPLRLPLDIRAFPGGRPLPEMCICWDKRCGCICCI